MRAKKDGCIYWPHVLVVDTCHTRVFQDTSDMLKYLFLCYALPSRIHWGRARTCRGDDGGTLGGHNAIFIF